MSKVIAHRSTIALDRPTHASLQPPAMMRDLSGTTSVSHHHHHHAPKPPPSAPGVSGVAPPPGSPHLKHDPARRTVLGRVNVNIAHNAGADSPALAAKKQSTQSAQPAQPAQSHGRVTRSGLTKTIPQPAPAPDVFASDSAAATLGKRSRADTGAREQQQVMSKRARAEASQQAARFMEEQNRWLGKWRKIFPSLVFHFDIGVDDVVGRGLKQRALDMGAVGR